MRYFQLGAASLLLSATAFMPVTAQGQTATRAQVQHVLRRFSFSAPPETVTAVLAGGIAPWLASQDDWSALDDSKSELETLPTSLNSDGGYIDYNVWERLVMQHMVLTPRQLQAKLELHWLDHFAVGLAKVGDPAVMYHYDQTVRANALGNFATLLAAVSQEPAMLEWLDNNYNIGPVANENFSRESMQLYSMGLYDLNQDGSVKMTGAGKPKPNYSQEDVQEIAKAMTGYGVVYDYTNMNPETRFSVQYYKDRHWKRPVKFFGKTYDVANDGTAIATVMTIIAKRPSVAPFEARELLQRFVTETPSAQYISDIAAVWRAKENAPDQIAQVITAIVNHPEFNSGYHAMPKQPLELVIGSLRQMPGMMQATADVSPGGSLLWETHNLGQEVFYPESVFSFYRPGGLESLTNTGSILALTGVFANISSAVPTNLNTDTWLDIPTLRARIGSTTGRVIRDYLLDAMVDGGSPGLLGVLNGYLGDTPSDARIQGAIWLLLNSPDYAVN